MALPVWSDQRILDQLLTGYRWYGGTITYSFPTTTASLSGATEPRSFSRLTAAQQDKATLALQLWGDLIPPTIQKSTGATDIEFGLTGDGTTYASTYFPSGGTVWFNKNESSLTAPVIGQHGFISYIHEIGHALGLDHMGDYNGSGNWTPSCFQDSTVDTVMSYFGPDWQKGEDQVAWADWTGSDGVIYAPQTPQLNDILAIQKIYGASTSTRVGNTIYGFNSNISDTTSQIFDFITNKNPIITIYDSSGADTLDLSGWTDNETIDLRPGKFSSGNAMTNNIAIAYNTIIENAVGGTGDDQFTGNRANNFLDGGDGVDRVIYNYLRKDFSFKLSGDALTVTDALPGREGVDTLVNIERVNFNDGALVLDIPQSSANSSLYRLYQASFARAPDEAGFRFWVAQSSAGDDPNSIATSFISSSEFKSKYGVDVTNAQYVDLLYQNVLDRLPDAAGQAFWVDMLQSAGLSRQDVLLSFANSPEDIAKTAANTDNGYWLV